MFQWLKTIWKTSCSVTVQFLTKHEKYRMIIWLTRVKQQHKFRSVYTDREKNDNSLELNRKCHWQNRMTACIHEYYCMNLLLYVNKIVWVRLCAWSRAFDACVCVHLEYTQSLQTNQLTTTTTAAATALIRNQLHERSLRCQFSSNRVFFLHCD